LERKFFACKREKTPHEKGEYLSEKLLGKGKQLAACLSPSRERWNRKKGKKMFSGVWRGIQELERLVDLIQQEGSRIFHRLNRQGPDSARLFTEGEKGKPYHRRQDGSIPFRSRIRLRGTGEG